MNKKIWGLILIVVGIAIVGNQMNMFDFRIAIYWPSILIFIGLSYIFNRDSSRTTGIILILIGGIMQMKNLGIINQVNIPIIFAVILIFVGIKILFFKTKKVKKNSTNNFDGIAIFSGFEEKNSSDNFEGGELFVMFGGAEIDLTQADIREGNIPEIDIFTAFGGVEITVPKGWGVRIKGLPLFGGWSNNADPKDKIANKEILINSTVLFGGIDVKN